MWATNCLFFFCFFFLLALFIHSLDFPVMSCASFWCVCVLFAPNDCLAFYPRNLHTFYTYFTEFYYSFHLYIKKNTNTTIFMCMTWCEILFFANADRHTHLWPEHRIRFTHRLSATQSNAIQMNRIWNMLQIEGFYLFYSTHFIWWWRLELDLYRRVFDAEIRMKYEKLVISWFTVDFRIILPTWAINNNKFLMYVFLYTWRVLLVIERQQPNAFRLALQCSRDLNLISFMHIYFFRYLFAECRCRKSFRVSCIRNIIVIGDVLSLSLSSNICRFDVAVWFSSFAKVKLWHPKWGMQCVQEMLTNKTHYMRQLSTVGWNSTGWSTNSMSAVTSIL